MFILAGVLGGPNKRLRATGHKNFREAQNTTILRQPRDADTERPPGTYGTKLLNHQAKQATAAHL